MTDDRDERKGEHGGEHGGGGATDEPPASGGGEPREPARPAAERERPEPDDDLSLRERDTSQRWLSTYGQPLWRIILLLALLVGIVVLRKPCAEGVAGFVGNFGPPRPAHADGGAARDRGAPPLPTSGQHAAPLVPPANPGDAAPRH